MRRASTQQHLVQARLQVEGFQQRLLFLERDVDHAGNEIGELRRAVHALQCGRKLGGNLRQHLKNLDGTLLERSPAAFDLRVEALRVVDVVDARDGERVVVQELQHAEAPQALADDVVHALGGRDIAQHARTRANPVQVVGPWVVGIGLALKQHADGLFQAHRFLHRGACAFAADCQRQHHAREQDGVAHRHDEQRIRRHWLGRDQRLRGRVGCLSVGRVRLRRTHVGARVLVHGCPSSIFRSLSVRQPWASSGEPISRRPRGNAMRRSKAP